jgi:hypothetical protein
MGAKPKKQDYKASASEKASASVAVAEKKNFEKYKVVMRAQRDQSLSTDPTRQLRSRANADTMQALTKNPTYNSTQALSQTGEVAQALQGQLNLAGAKGKKIENSLQTEALNQGRGLAANALSRASNKQNVRNSRNAAAAQIGSALAFQGLENMQARGTKAGPAPTDTSGNRVQGPPAPVEARGSFFAPVNSQGQKALGFVNRVNYTGTVNNPSNPFSPYRSD